jgi:hypothetical protein
MELACLIGQLTRPGTRRPTDSGTRQIATLVAMAAVRVCGFRRVASAKLETAGSGLQDHIDMRRWHPGDCAQACPAHEQVSFGSASSEWRVRHYVAVISPVAWCGELNLRQSRGRPQMARGVRHWMAQIEDEGTGARGGGEETTNHTTP